MPRRKAELAAGVDVAGTAQQQDPASAAEDDVDVDDAGEPIRPRASGCLSGEGVEHGELLLSWCLRWRLGWERLRPGARRGHVAYRDLGPDAFAGLADGRLATPYSARQGVDNSQAAASLREPGRRAQHGDARSLVPALDGQHSPVGQQAQADDEYIVGYLNRRGCVHGVGGHLAGDQLGGLSELAEAPLSKGGPDVAACQARGGRQRGERRRRTHSRPSHGSGNARATAGHNDVSRHPAHGTGPRQAAAAGASAVIVAIVLPPNAACSCW